MGLPPLCLFGLFKLDAFTEWMLRQKKENLFLVMKREFQRPLDEIVKKIKREKMTMTAI